MTTRRVGRESRTATAADAPGLAELFEVSGAPTAAARLVPRLDALRGVPGACLLASAWGPPSGLVLVHWRPTLADDWPAAHVDHLLVHPDERRRGVGRMLLKAASQAARAAGCGVIEIAVSSGDPSLGAFCEATGFASAASLWSRPLRKT